MVQSPHERTIFFQRSEEDRRRATSAYKLIQIHHKLRIFDGVTKAVDLCAAPGGWSEVLVREIRINGRGNYKLISVDIKSMAPIPGTIQIQGDISNPNTVNQITSHFENDKADLVVCDGELNATGRRDFEENIQAQLLLAALKIATRVLRNRGTFVARIFRGRNVPLLYSQLKVFFQHVYCAKPAISRNLPTEAFVVCQIYQPPANYSPDMFDYLMSEKAEYYFRNIDNHAVLPSVPYVECGSSEG